MANRPAGIDGDRVTDGIQVRTYIAPKQYERLKARWLARSQELGQPIALSQVVREIIDHALRHPPPQRPRKPRTAGRSGGGDATRSGGSTGRQDTGMVVG